MIPERQHCPTGPARYPVFQYGTGAMYLGGYDASESRSGLGAFLDVDGHLQIGHWNDDELCGPGIHLWIAESPTWKENLYGDASSSEIALGERGLPFIYIGEFKKGFMHDRNATVILKDGTTRIGPWEEGMPLGDWWNDHTPLVTPSKEISKYLTPIESDHGEGGRKRKRDSVESVPFQERALVTPSIESGNDTD